MKSKVDKLDVDKLLPAPVDLTELRDVRKKDVQGFQSCIVKNYMVKVYYKKVLILVSTEGPLWLSLITFICLLRWSTGLTKGKLPRK